MSRARILLVVVALVAGGLAAFLATRGSAPTPAEKVTVTEVQQEPKTRILVASAPIGVGERLSLSNMEWQDWPEGAVRPEYVTISLVPDATDRLTGVVARFEFFPGEPIREAKLARANSGYLSAVLEPGMRAVSIDVTATSASGGFIVPNDRVDVVVTRNTVNGDQSETILRNIKVLAIGPRLGELGKTGGGSGNPNEDPQNQNFQKSTIATLELTPTQAEGLITAEEQGKLTLALRSVADFGEKIELGSNTSSTVRMVRFGKPVEISAGGTPVDAIAQAGGGEVSPPETAETLVLSPTEPGPSDAAPSAPQFTDGPGPGGQRPVVN